MLSCLVVVLFLIAFTLDRITEQRYSSLFGGTAIAASLLAFFPSLRHFIVFFIPFAALWIIFNGIRAVADSAGMALVDERFVFDFESKLFFGTLPSTFLQRHFHSPRPAGWHDLLASITHLSYFIAPFITALLLYFRNRVALRRYTCATALSFGMGLLGFLLIPTTPPWMADQSNVTRVIFDVLPAPLVESQTSRTSNLTPEQGLSFEPNHIAAFPSMHVAIALLVGLTMGHYGLVLRWTGLAYAAMMSASVVYLGEHYLIDVIAAWVVALAAWSASDRMTIGRLHPTRLI